MEVNQIPIENQINQYIYLSEVINKRCEEKVGEEGNKTDWHKKQGREEMGRYIKGKVEKQRQWGERDGMTEYTVKTKYELVKELSKNL